MSKRVADTTQTFLLISPPGQYLGSVDTSVKIRSATPGMSHPPRHVVDWIQDQKSLSPASTTT